MAGRICVNMFMIFMILEISYAMTTTRRPNEADNYNFSYDPTSYMLGLSNFYHHTKTCYVMKLTPEEQRLIRTHDGLTRLQLKMLTHLSSATTMMTVDELTAASARLAHYCTKATNIYSLSV